jgi:hypothetical protein
LGIGLPTYYYTTFNIIACIPTDPFLVRKVHLSALDD